MVPEKESDGFFDSGIGEALLAFGTKLGGAFITDEFGTATPKAGTGGTTPAIVQPVPTAKTQIKTVAKEGDMSPILVVGALVAVLFFLG